jgi:cation-transporting ATPase 13A3/4/5
VIARDAGEVDIVLTKPAFKHLQDSGEASQILDKVRIYARMKPEDKVAVIQLHQDRGLVVGMVGDGGNDCGALRAAHVGIALSEAEASIVAPFSSREEHGTGSISLRAVPDLLRYGRATLATNLATYMYFMVYALAIPIAKFTCIFIGNMILSEWTWISTDIIVGSIMVAAMTLARPGPKLAELRPTSELLGWRTVATVLVPTCIYGACFMVALFFLWQQPFYRPYDSVALGVPSHEWQKKGDNFECGVAFFFLSMQLPTACFIYSHGAEHRMSPLRNIPLAVSYLLIIIVLFCVLWGGPSPLSCVFRVNCDSYTSNRMYVPGVQEFSTGNIGGCFLGPQLMEWKNRLGDSFQFPSELNACNPSQGINLEDKIRSPSGAISWLGAAECRGPNNCFSSEFRTVMTVLLAVMVGTTHGVGIWMSGWHPAPKLHFKKL